MTSNDIHDIVREHWLAREIRLFHPQLIGLYATVYLLAVCVPRGFSQGNDSNKKDLPLPSPISVSGLPLGDTNVGQSPVSPEPYEILTSPWYGSFESAVLFNSAIHFNDEFASVDRNNTAFLSSRVSVGRLLDGGRSIRFTYRNLTEVGRVGSDEAYRTWSSNNTFSTNWFDLDCVSREYAPLEWWRLRGELGGRFVFRHEGSKQQTPYARYEYSQNYFGGGPHIALTSNLLLGQSGWSVFGRLDTGITFGSAEATSHYQPLHVDPWGWMDSPRSQRVSFFEYQFDATLQLGLTRRWQSRYRDYTFGLGVQADALTIGTRGNGDFNSFGLVNVGPFLKLEIGF